MLQQHYPIPLGFDFTGIRQISSLSATIPRIKSIQRFLQNGAKVHKYQNPSVVDVYAVDALIGILLHIVAITKAMRLWPDATALG